MSISHDGLCYNTPYFNRHTGKQRAMYGDEIVVQTRLIPPRLPRRWLRRARLDRLLARAAEYPVTVVSASAGYGKSSALASFAARGGWPIAWCSLGEGVADPLVFLLHLTYACRRIVPGAGDRAIVLLEQHSQGTQAWSQALDALINDLARLLDDETILVLDDFHAVDDLTDIGALVERLIAQAPPLLHVLLASRRWPQLGSLPILQARGELFAIGEAELAFSEEEIAALFDLDDEESLSGAQAAAVSEQTRGWPIALQLLWQNFRRPTTDDQRSTSDRDQDMPRWSVLGGQSSLSQDVLFAYLAQEVLAAQPEDIQTFLLRSSILAELEAATCDVVLGAANSSAWLRALYRRGLFLTALGEGQYRYHPLFHAFLQQRARDTLPDWAELHGRAAGYYRGLGAGEQVLYHLLAVGDAAAAAAELGRLAQPWLDSGRFVTLIDWLDRLPADALAAHPWLLIARGDAERLLARFDAALAAYAEAERRFAARQDAIGQAHALKGQAQVYLDTVRPAPANVLLRRAYKLLPPQLRDARAGVLRLIAENRLNSGRADQAVRLYRLAGSIGLADSSSGPDARMFLRLGRLVEARAILEGQRERERAVPDGARRPEGHREPTMLLSLVCALLGDAEVALRYAQEGLESANRLGSALSEAIAHIRIGNALQLVDSPDLAAANQHYLRAMALADTFAVPRTKASAYLGLALLHGFDGDMDAARAAVREGLAIVERSGDAWTAARLWTALGAIGATTGEPEAEAWLAEALRRHQQCRDTYGQTVVRLYCSIGHHRAGRLDEAARDARETLELARRYRYAGLLTRSTLFGPRDRMALVPVLLAGRAAPELRAWAQELLAQGFPPIAADESIQAYHPGSTLRIKLLERLQVWRGGEEIESRAWQRKKAQQMLALLLTNRHRWLLRDQICEWLWAEDSEADSETQFKVTLNALNTVLEPLRPPRTPPFYIRRQGGAYRFCPPDGVWIDVAEFDERLDTARRWLAECGNGDTPAGADQATRAQEQIAQALGLYGGDYLGDYLYEDWASGERERLATRYLEAATLLAELLIERGQVAEAIRFCEGILARDPCWEDAYRLLMRAYARQGNRRQALATYDRCVRNLRTHLDVAPLPQTTEVYEEVKKV
jgi:ATP/maltotriose-dependent transcriptional regulator MalT/DNA-binding SARP family transcriptional activator